ncbi:MAG: NAD(P)H-hydrate dehydratase [Planctomycetes bacterium]|nr:NAD(P)H-hydrate dehydratase [Planctomycetota bacterium]
MSPSPPFVISDVPALPARAPRTHKHEQGRIAVVGGSRGMSGAAILCGLGALRGGAGLVRICCGTSVLPIVAAAEPCLMTRAIAEDERFRFAARDVNLELDLNWADVLAIGPGLESGQSPTFMKALPARDGPQVWDAGALSWLAGCGEMRELLQQRACGTTVVTPHAGEMRRLCAALGFSAGGLDEDDERLRTANKFAALTGAVVVLKGHRTVVCAPAEAQGRPRAFINSTGNPGLATAGTGDVLTGLIAALIGQGMTPFDACRLAVHAHGAAADRLARRIGPVGYLAREVADELPAALAEASIPRIGFR